MAVKSKILKSLEKNRGEFVSGQELARSLAVSRTSIWKSIKQLQDEGYPIEAVTNRGYMLSEDSNILSLSEISSNLDPTVDPSLIQIFKSTDSTNNEAKRIIINNYDEKFGSVIIAGEQTAGKGRQGREFSSPPGDSLYISFILKPLLDVHDSLLVTVAASVAVVRAIKKIGHINDENLNPMIKWVNDIFLDSKKVCGILTEAVTDVESGQIKSLVLGIGINVNIDRRKYPEKIQSIIGSLGIKPGQRNKFSALVINEVFHIQEEISDFATGNSVRPSFMSEYREMSLVLGKDIKVIKGDERLSAKALDINDRGGLLVRFESGETEILDTGEISIRLNS